MQKWDTAHIKPQAKFHGSERNEFDLQENLHTAQKVISPLYLKVRQVGKWCDVTPLPALFGSF